MRSSKGGTHRPKRARSSTGLTAEETEKRLTRVRKKIRSAEAYLERELDRLVKEEGNAAETIRLLKHFYEARQEAWSELQEAQRLEGASGTNADFLGAGIGSAGGVEADDKQPE